MMPQVMPIFARILAGSIAAAALCGCVDARQEAIDHAYRRGHISAAERQRLTEESTAPRLAAIEAHIRQSQQQPRSNRNHDKLVSPQPAEHPFHAGRPLDENVHQP